MKKRNWLVLFLLLLCLSFSTVSASEDTKQDDTYTVGAEEEKEEKPENEAGLTTYIGIGVFAVAVVFGVKSIKAAREEA